MKTILSALGLSLLIFTSCGGQKKVEVDFIQDNIDNAVAQNTIQTDIIEKSGKILNPRTINADGSISYIPIDEKVVAFGRKIHRSPRFCEISEVASRCRLYDRVQLS